MSYDLRIVNGDLSLKGSEIEKITGAEKLSQEILKIALTPVGGNFFNPGYGSYFSQSLIGSYLEQDIAISVAENQLKDSLENLKVLQNAAQSQFYQKMLPSELLAAVQRVSIQPSPNDPRAYSVFINYISKAFTQSSVSFGV